MKGNQILLFVTWLMAFLYPGSVTAQQDQLLTPESFIENVKRFHPVARQANLITANAKAGLLQAQGAFDPVFEMNNQQKTLDGINYYQYANPELKVATMGGVTVKSGWEKSGGQFINPELTRGVNSYIGAEISLLNGLLSDRRRAGLQQARLYRQQSEEERRLMINDLLLEAYTSYWHWAAAFQLYYLYKSYVDNADKRIRLIRLTYQQGDRALADTVEAFTQYQQYLLLQQEALMDVRNSSLRLSDFLWDENEIPFLLPTSFIPDTARLQAGVVLEDSETLIQQLVDAHPALRNYDFKLQGLEVEKRLRFQQLLPLVVVRANLLSKDYYDFKGINTAYLENNQKFGFTIKMPLLLRQERGLFQKTKIALRETELMQSQKTWELQNKVRQYHNEAEQLNEQLRTATSMYNNVAFLLRNEELKFSQGESSLFLINTRENKVIELQQKLIELRIKYFKAIYGMRWAAGTIQ